MESDGNFCSWDEDIKDDFYPWKRYIKDEATRGV